MPGTYPVLCAYSIFSHKIRFFEFSEKSLLFLASNIVISIHYYNFFFKILFFVKIKNKRTKPYTSQISLYEGIDFKSQREKGIDCNPTKETE